MYPQEAGAASAGVEAEAEAQAEAGAGAGASADWRRGRRAAPTAGVTASRSSVYEYEL